jgi:DNA-binding CsgD family transcriptional regulator
MPLLLVNYWNQLSHGFTESQLDQATETIKKLNPLSSVFDGCFVFIDTKSKRSIMSFGNIEEITGYPALYFKTNPIELVVKAIEKTVKRKIHTLLENLLSHFFDSNNAISRIQEIVMNGVNISVKGTNLTRKMHVKLHPVLYDQEGNIAVIQLMFKEITHLVNNEDIWCRLLSEDGLIMYNSTQEIRKKSLDSDIFTEREMEVLRLLQLRKSNVYVARRLGINANTLLQHQKNMMAKLGTVDRSSLLFLSRLSGII